MIKLNRTRIILLSLITSTLILVIPAAVSWRVRLAAADLFEPVTSTARNLLGGVRARIAAFGRGTDLQEELATERKRRMELEALLAENVEQLARLRRARSESAELSRALGRSRWRRGLPVAANVIRRPGKWESHEVVIDRGASGGVTRGCPVLVGEAVLGVVAEVTPETSRVLILGHPEVAVPARIVRTRQQGLVESAGRKLKLNYVVRNPRRPVRRDHVIVTSGLGGVFPPGCLIGQVGPGVAPAEGKPFYDIAVVPPQSTRNPEVAWVLVKPLRTGPGTGKRSR
jgi:rod shape-determining protein MreC